MINALCRLIGVGFLLITFFPVGLCQESGYSTSDYRKVTVGITERISKGDFESALDLVQNALTKYGDKSVLFRLRGDVEKKMKKYELAITSYTKSLRLNSEDTLSYLGRAESKRFSGFYQNAIDDYGETLRLDPTEVIAYFGRGSCYYEMVKNVEALDDFNKCIELWPSNPAFFFKRGIVFYSIGDDRSAIADFTRCLKLDKTDPYGVRYYRGLCYVRIADRSAPKAVDSAIFDFNNYLLYASSEKRLVSLRSLGTAYGLKGDSIRSRINFERSLALGQEDSETLFRFGTSELNFGHFQKAVGFLQKASSKINNPTPDIFYYLALAKSNLGDTLAAVNDFDMALSIDNTRRDIYQARIKFLVHNPKYFDKTLADLNHLISSTTSKQEKAEEFAFKCMIDIQRDHLNKARIEIDSAISLMPSESIYLMLRALVNSKDPAIHNELVLSDVNKAIHLNPADRSAYVFKASYLASRGDYQNACKAIRFAIDIGEKIPKDILDYVCKGKKPRDGKVPELFVPFAPK